MRTKRARPDLLLPRIAERQHGVVALSQLLEAGLSRSAVKRRAAAGRLHRIHRGVYAVGHPNLGQKGRWMAAVLACGAGAVLGFESAGALWHILTLPTSSPVHVVVPSYAGRSKRSGIVVHYSATLDDTDVTRLDGIPVTTRARTLADLGFGSEPTRSHLERAFLRIVRSHGLPLPEVNAKLGPYTVDFLWRDHRLVVETDGFAHHSDRAAFEADRRRDRELQRRGFVVLRFTYREVTDEPDAVADSLRAHLSRLP